MNPAFATPSCPLHRWFWSLRQGDHGLPFLSAVGLAAILATGSARAQTVPAPTTGPSGEEPPVELSPFIVQENTTETYSAHSTLSATRFRSSVSDVGSSLTIITPEFVADLAATTVDDVLLFAPTTEINSTQEAKNDGSNLSYVDRVRVRGILVEANLKNYFMTSVPSDTYNLESFTLSRGANAVLFGVGNPTAAVNRSTKLANPSRNEGEVQYRTSEHGTQRVSFDYNQVLWKNRLALRVDALYEDARTWRHPDYRKDQRYYFAAAYRILPHTTVRANYEHFKWVRTAAQEAIPFDAVTPWLNAGRPTRPSDPTRPATNPPGVTVLTGAPRTVLVYDGNESTPLVQDWRNYAIGAGRSLVGTGSVALPLNFFDQHFSLVGAQRRQDFDGNSGNVSIEQRLASNLFVELSANREALTYGFHGMSSSTTLSVDASDTLPDGSPNPNRGKFFTGSAVPNFNIQDRYRNAYRFTASYELNLADKNRWLGRHQLAILAEREDFNWYISMTAPINTTPLPGYPTSLSDGSNRIRYVYYVDLERKQHLGDTDPSVLPKSGGINGAFLPINPPTNQRTTTKSFLGVLQSKFWNDRLVSTVGWRGTVLDLETINPSSVVPAAPGLNGWAHGTTRLKEPTITGIDLNSYSVGGAWHFIRNWGVLDQVSLVGNKGTTFNPVVLQPGADGTPLPRQSGESRDIGIRFNILQNRLSGVLNYFQATSLNGKLQAAQDLRTNVNNLWNATGHPERVSLFDDTADFASKGYEFQLAGNPTPNWRVAVAVSHFATVMTNSIPRLLATLPSMKAVWLDPSNANKTIGGNNQPVPTVVANLDFQIAKILAQNGNRTENERRGKFSLLTNYRIEHGPVQGLGFGGSVIWQDKPAIGFALKQIPGSGNTPPAWIPDPVHPFFGTDLLVVGANVSYRRKMARDRVTWTIQLNATDLLHGSYDTFPNEAFADSAAPNVPVTTNYHIVNPRQLVLTNTFKF